MLVAISIPIFTTQLEKSREATDIANVRTAYAEVMSKYLTDNDGSTSFSATVAAKQVQSGWQGTSGVLVTRIDGVSANLPIPGSVTSGSSWTINISKDGKTVSFK